VDQSDLVTSEDIGALPLGDPFPYVARDLAHARQLLAGARHSAVTTWWHETPAVHIPSIATIGLVPGCWTGSGDCVVFGLEDRADVSADRGLAVVEVRSPVPPAPAKAWWVPPEYIVGFWMPDDSFLDRQTASAREPHSDMVFTRDGCSCELATLCASERARCLRLAEIGHQARC